MSTPVQRTRPRYRVVFGKDAQDLEGKLNKGEVVYYAIVYEAPVLGALQRLRVSVSQTEAADEPVTAALGTATGRK